MKKSIIYALIGCLFSPFIACTDSIEDATSKHVYSENENPYLKTNSNATITNEIEFPVGHFETQTIKLTDYAEKFQENMGMTVDQVISGLENGSVVFYNITPSKNSWNKTSMTKGTTGWYYNSAGGICQENEPSLLVSLDINTENKTLNINAYETATVGSLASLNVGFAINGNNYDEYVRFTFNISITDPSIILTNISIPDGDYASFGIDFNQYAETIQTCMGLSVADFLANLDYNGDTGEATNGVIHMYVVDPVSAAWDTTSSYTAESPGYWMDNQGAVCNWGGNNFTFYANTKNGDEMLYVGRAPGLAAGSKYTISIGYRNTENENNFFRFIITATLE